VTAGGEKGNDLNRERLNLTSPRIASRRLRRAVTLLFRAGKQLDAASITSPDRYGAERLRFFATGVRDVALPLSKIASCLERGRDL
jgi:hypothetical protein